MKLKRLEDFKLVKPYSFPYDKEDKIRKIENSEGSFTNGFILDLCVSDKDKDRLKKLSFPPVDEEKIIPILALCPPDDQVGEAKYVRLDTPQPQVILVGRNRFIVVSARYYGYFRRRYPRAIYLFDEPEGPVFVKTDGKINGAIMPFYTGLTGFTVKYLEKQLGRE